MKKLLFGLIVLFLFSCEKDNGITQEFQIIDKEAEIPTLYFYKGYDPIVKGIAKGVAEVEITADADVDAKITGVFHIGYQTFAGKYKKDIYSESFSLKKGEVFKYSGNFSFYGTINDKAFILVDVKTNSPTKLSSCPVQISKSNISIIK